MDAGMGKLADMFPPGNARDLVAMSVKSFVEQERPKDPSPTTPNRITLGPRSLRLIADREKHFRLNGKDGMAKLAEISRSCLTTFRGG